VITILYSFAKTGEEAHHWQRELSAASGERFRIVPFNHRSILGRYYADAWTLDMDHRRGSPALRRLETELRRALAESRADCLFVTNDNPYHPELLLRLPVYRAYYTTDDPGATYQRTIPYLHAFHHVFHCALPYAPGRTLREKLLEAGARRVDFLPLGVFDYELDATRTEREVLGAERDIDVVYIGSPFFAQKLEAMVAIARAFPRGLRMYGFWRAKHNAYFSMRAGRPWWVRPIGFEERVRIYQRSRIGFNLHWDDYGLGNQRLYHLPANGVMQVSDSVEHLGEIFEIGTEVAAASGPAEMVEKVRHYLGHEGERERIARAGYLRVQRDYRIRKVVQQMVGAVEAGMRA